jgi:hypothetical protein
MCNPVSFELFLVLDAAYYGQIYRVLVFLTGSQSSTQHNILWFDIIHGKKVSGGKLALGECTGFIRAKHINTG